MPFGHSFPQRTFTSNKVGTSIPIDVDGLGMMLATKTTCVAASQPDNFIKVGHRGIDFAKFECFDPCMTWWGIQVVVVVLWEAVMVGIWAEGTVNACWMVYCLSFGMDKVGTLHNNVLEHMKPTPQRTSGVFFSTSSATRIQIVGMTEFRNLCGGSVAAGYLTRTLVMELCRSVGLKFGEGCLFSYFVSFLELSDPVGFRLWIASGSWQNCGRGAYDWQTHGDMTPTAN